MFRRRGRVVALLWLSSLVGWSSAAWSAPDQGSEAGPRDSRPDALKGDVNRPDRSPVLDGRGGDLLLAKDKAHAVEAVARDRSAVDRAVDGKAAPDTTKPAVIPDYNTSGCSCSLGPSPEHAATTGLLLLPVLGLLLGFVSIRTWAKRNDKRGRLMTARPATRIGVVSGMLIAISSLSSQRADAQQSPGPQAPAGESSAQPDTQDTKAMLNMSLEDLLDSPVVTASRSEKKIKDLPMTVRVITREEILNNDYKTIVDVLKDQPGIIVSQPGSSTDGETFLMRGLYGNAYTKILLDGQPLMPSVAGAMPIGAQLPLQLVERIEIVYGPAAAIYGADALGGVVNIITKIPERDTVQARVVLGQLGYQHYNFLAASSLGEGANIVRFGLYGHYSRRSDLNVKDGYASLYEPIQYRRFFDFGNDKVTLGDLPNESYNVGATASYRGFRLSYDLMYRNEPSSLGQQTAWYFYDDPHAIWGETIQRATLSHSASVHKLTFNTNLSYLRYRLDPQSYYKFVFTPTFQAFKYAASDDIIFDEVVTFNPLKNLELVAGVLFQTSSGISKTNDLNRPFDPQKYVPFSSTQIEFQHSSDADFNRLGLYNKLYSTVGTFLQGSYTLGPLTALAGVRFDWHSIYGSSVNPRVAAKLDLHKTTSIRASFNTAFKAPSSYYIYNTVASLTDSGKINYMFVPNEHLQPEKLLAGEVAVQSVLGKRFSVELVGHLSRVSHLISFGVPVRIDGSDPNFPAMPNRAANNNTAQAFYNDDNAKTVIYGVDINLSARRIIPAVNLNADLFLSVVKGQETLAGFDPANADKAPLDNFQISELRRVPRFYGTFRLSAKPTLKSYVGLDAHFSTAKYVGRITSNQPYSDSLSWGDKYVNYGSPTSLVRAYVTFDLVSQVEIYKGLYGLIKAINIFDTAHGGIDAYNTSGDLVFNPQQGRTLYAGLGYTY